jgi:hypothetical protein
MSWTAITAAILKERKVAPLIDAAKDYAAGLTPAQSDPTAAIIASTVKSIRAAVRSCSKNQLDIDTTKIPGDLIDLACRMITFQLKNFVEVELTQDERDDKRADARLLERIASCELAVEATTTPETTATIQSPSGSPSISAPDRTFSRTQQDGI